MDGMTNKTVRKRLGELLVESGIVAADAVPRGLEYAQKAADGDAEMIADLKQIIDQQGLSVDIALRALLTARQKHCSLPDALIAVGWRPRPDGTDARNVARSSFETSELDAIGSHRLPTEHGSAGLAAGLKARGIVPNASNTSTRLKAWKAEESGASSTAGASQGAADEAGAGMTAPPPFPRVSPPPLPRISPPPLPGASPPSLPGASPPALPGSSLPRIVPPSLPRVSPPPLPAASPPPLPAASPPLPAASPPPLPAASPPPFPAASPPPFPAASPPPLPAPAAEQNLEQAAPPPVAPEVSELVYAGDRAYGDDAYDQASSYYERALSALERSVNVPNLEVAELLVKLGRACLQQSEFGRSEAHLTRALKIREIDLGWDDILTAECLDHLAELYDVQSQYLEAEHFYLSALGVKERILRPGDSEIARSLKKLVAVSKHRGSHPDEKLSGQLLTEAGLIDARKLEEGLQIASDNAVPIGRALISLNYLTETDLQSVLQAQLLLREGVVPGYLAVRALRIASEQRIDFRSALHEIGLEPEKIDNKKAFDLLHAAQELVNAEAQMSLDDPEIAMLCMKLGDLYVEHQQHPHAELLYERALTVLESQGNADFGFVCELYTRLGQMFFKTGRYDNAEIAFTKLVDALEAKQQNESVAFFNALENLAAVHYVRGNYQESGRLFQLCLTNKERLLKADHPGLSASLQGRANCFYASDRLAEAEKLYRRAIELNDKVFGKNHEGNAGIFNVLGDLHFRQDQFELAQLEYLHGLECLSNSANPDVWLFSAMLQKLAKSYVLLGDLVRGDVYYRQFLQARQSAGTDNAPDMVETFESYAAVLENLQRPEEAATMLGKAYALRRACQQP